jgi:chromatin remodeling complex protein RSC6
VHLPKIECRPEVGALAAQIDVQGVKKSWAYVTEHGLHDRNDPKYVNADEPLRRVFRGEERVSLFDMTGYLGRYLREVKS